MSNALWVAKSKERKEIEVASKVAVLAGAAAAVALTILVKL